MTSQTVLTLLTAAAEELEVIDSGGTLSGDEQVSGLDRFNRMVDASCIDPGMIYTEHLDTVVLAGNRQSYTIGTNPAGTGFLADFNITRPAKITRANLLLSTTVRRPLKLYTPAEWAAIRYQLVYGPPDGFYDDDAFVTGFSTLRFWQIPDKAYSVELYSWQQNAAAADVTALINYPPGYADFWLYSLAMRIAPMFGRAITADLRESYRAARALILARNAKSPALGTEPALMTGEGATYNWLSGTED